MGLNYSGFGIKPMNLTGNPHDWSEVPDRSRERR